MDDLSKNVVSIEEMLASMGVKDDNGRLTANANLHRPVSRSVISDNTLASESTVPTMFQGSNDMGRVGLLPTESSHLGLGDSLVTSESRIRSAHVSMPTRLRRVDDDVKSDNPGVDVISNDPVPMTAVFGLPTGRSVLVGNPTVSDRSHQANPTLAVAAQAIEDILDEQYGTRVVTTLGVVSYIPSALRTNNPEYYPSLSMSLIDSKLQLVAWMTQEDLIVDVEILGDSAVLSDWAQLRLWAAALMKAMLARPLSVTNYTVLDECPMKDIAREPHGVWKGPHQAFHKLIPTNSQLISTVDCGMYADGVVAYGRVPAAEVPAGVFVVFGANGGKSVTGSAIALKWGDCGAYIVTSNAVAGMHAYPENKTVLPPLAKDTASSLRLCRSVRSRGANSLSLEYEHAYDGDCAETFPTFLHDAFDQGSLVLYTRNLALMEQELYSLIKMMKYILVPSDYGYVVQTPKGKRCTVYLEYGSATVTDFQTLGPRSEQNPFISEALCEHNSSELMLAVGMSSVARFLMRRHIVQGRLSPLVHALHRSRNPCYGEESWSFRNSKMAVIESSPVDYVVDLEYIQHRETDGKLCSFVYAAGLAKFSEGRYLGSILTADTSVEAAMMLADPKVREEDTRNYSEIVQQRVRFHPPVITDLVNKLVKHSGSRVFAKGRDNDARILAAKPVHGTRLLAPSSDRLALRELGHLSPRVEKISADVGWPIGHNPARECVLFAYATGLCHSLPNIDVVGHDSPDVFEPDISGVFT